MKVHISPDDLPSPERRAEFQDVIDSLRECARRELNAWERDSLDSIEAQLVSMPGQNLTIPPGENLTGRRGDEPQFVATS